MTADTLADTEEQHAVVVGTKVVLVDERPERRAVMRQMFEHAGIDAAVVAEAGGETDALALITEHGADLAVLDLPATVQHGLDAIVALRRRFPDLAIVVGSFVVDPAIKAQALAGGADAYLVKPVSARELIAAVPKNRSTPKPV
jgi:CheY-like chemotaxis protein